MLQWRNYTESGCLYPVACSISDLAMFAIVCYVLLRSVALEKGNDNALERC